MDMIPEEFDKLTRYLAMDDAEADRRRAQVLGFDNAVMVAPGAIIRIGVNRIGKNSFIGLYSYLNGDVRIGANVLIGPHCSLPAGNHKFDPATKAFNTMRDKPEPIVIGDGSWLASGVTVTSGVTIGRGVLVCANSVVTRDLPDFVIAAGTPAKVVGTIGPETGEYHWLDK